MRRARHLGPGDARLYSTYCVIGKLPAAVGQAKYWAMRMLGRRSKLIEYKRAAPVKQGAGAA
jgi:hypothetical protein